MIFFYTKNPNLKKKSFLRWSGGAEVSDFVFKYESKSKKKIF